MKKEIVISCFDKTTNMVKPWAKAGYLCYCVDIEHKQGYNYDMKNNIVLVGANILDWIPPEKAKVKISFFFPPCTDLAISGARWFKMKGLDSLIEALKLFSASIKFAEEFNAPYMIENPISTVSTYWRKPDYKFQPWMYGDMYLKRTCLWTGNGFVMPEKINEYQPDGVEDYIHRLPPSENRSELRAITPINFAKYVYEANK